MRPCTKHWTTADGRTLRVCDMTDAHLLNTIRYLRRRSEDNEAALYGKSLMSVVLNATRPGDHFPIYNDMVKDAARRLLATVEDSEPKRHHHTYNDQWMVREDDYSLWEDRHGW